MSDYTSTTPLAPPALDGAQGSTASLSRVVLVQLDQVAALLVGSSSVDLAQNRVKRAMVCEALARTQGNFTKAADLLGVRRQAIQHMVSRYDLRSWAADIRR
jgi:DNA-binding protein Fis